MFYPAKTGSFNINVRYKMKNLTLVAIAAMLVSGTAMAVSPSTVGFASGALSGSSTSVDVGASSTTGRHATGPSSASASVVSGGIAGSSTIVSAGRSGVTSTSYAGSLSGTRGSVASSGNAGAGAVGGTLTGAGAGNLGNFNLVTQHHD